MTVSDQAERFQALHQQGCFVIANAWDAGSARILAHIGFPGLLQGVRSHAAIEAMMGE